MRTTTRTAAIAAIAAAAGLTAGCAGIAGATTTPKPSTASQNLAKLEREIQSGKPFALKGREYIGAGVLGRWSPANTCNASYEGKIAVLYGVKAQYAVQCTGGHWWLMARSKA